MQLKWQVHTHPCSYKFSDKSILHSFLRASTMGDSLGSPDPSRFLWVSHRKASTFYSTFRVVSTWQHCTCCYNHFKCSLCNNKNFALFTLFLLIFFALVEWCTSANWKEMKFQRPARYSLFCEERDIFPWMLLYAPWGLRSTVCHILWTTTTEKSSSKPMISTRAFHPFSK